MKVAPAKVLPAGIVAPGAVDRQPGDRVEDLDRRFRRREQRRALDECRTAEVGHDRITALDRIFERQGRRPAGAERGRVGQEVRRGPVRAAADAEPAEVVGIEVEERRRATGGDAGELDERLVKDDLMLRLAEEVDADRRLGVALADRGAGVELAGTARDLVADERAQGAVGGLRAGVEIEAAGRPEAGRRLRELTRRGDVVLEASAAGDAQAGVRARDVEEPDP